MAGITSVPVELLLTIGEEILNSHKSSHPPFALLQARSPCNDLQAEAPSLAPDLEPLRILRSVCKLFDHVFAPQVLSHLVFSINPGKLGALQAQLLAVATDVRKRRYARSLYIEVSNALEEATLQFDDMAPDVLLNLKRQLIEASMSLTSLRRVK